MRDAPRSNPSFSVHRLFICLATMLVVLTTDVLFLHIKPAQTTTGFAVELAIHTLGFYGGFIIMALFNLAETRQESGDGGKRG